MNILAACIFASLAILLGWRGARRGAVAGVRHCAPFAAAVCVLLVAFRAAWTWPAHFLILCGAGGVLAVAAAIGMARALRRLRRRESPRQSHPILLMNCRPPGSSSIMRQPPRPAAKALVLLDRFLGVVLGALHACLLCMALAMVGSGVCYALARPAAPNAPHAPNPPTRHWMLALGQTCRVVDRAGFRLLDRVPGLSEYGGEIHALVVILNTPQERLTQLARDRGLDQLADIPEIQAAVEDEQFMGLVDRLRGGDFSALPRLADSPVTERLLACPQLRELAQKLKPSDLAREIESEDTAVARDVP